MKKIVLIYFCLLSALLHGQTFGLKSIIYDFDGLDIGQTDLPEGDYKNFDLTYKIAKNPLTASDVLGDRVLELDLNWATGSGEFGKGITKYIELNPSIDYFNFYCYNPLSNYSSAEVEVTITEDDDGNDIYDTTLDDKWKCTTTVPQSPGWQLVSVPLSAFADNNSGGNGFFDAGYSGNGGKIFAVSLTFKKAVTTNHPETYYIDMLCFSEGILPTGNTILDLPSKNIGDHCLLGSLAYRTPIDSVPIEVEALFPSDNKLSYINIFMPFAYAGTVASALPGLSVQTLLNNGYRPIITWEMMYYSYSSQDSVQPKLNQITNGSFDAYIDTFADKIKSYNDTICIRLFHEFDGDWYSWSIALNNQDPNELINAFRYIVDRFRARGATKVKWIWSPNSSPTPTTNYNWFVSAYPGDNYVDIVATSIYNHPTSGVPPWKSFRSVLTECYYTMEKYFPNKPFFICELACRERYNTEPLDSQSKAEWLCQMNKDLQSYFNKTRALIFFNTFKEHDWRINSSAASLEAVTTCIWENAYYSEEPLSTSHLLTPLLYNVYPNPFMNEINIFTNIEGGNSGIARIYDMMGKEVDKYMLTPQLIIGNKLSSGMYILELTKDNYSKKIKIIKQ